MAKEIFSTQKCPECGSLMYEYKESVQEQVEEYYLPRVKRREDIVSGLQTVLTLNLLETDEKAAIAQILPESDLRSEKKDIIQARLLVKSDLIRALYRRRLEAETLGVDIKTLNIHDFRQIKPDSFIPKNAQRWLDHYQLLLDRDRLSMLNILKNGKESMVLGCHTCGYSMAWS